MCNILYIPSYLLPVPASEQGYVQYPSYLLPVRASEQGYVQYPIYTLIFITCACK